MHSKHVGGLFKLIDKENCYYISRKSEVLSEFVKKAFNLMEFVEIFTSMAHYVDVIGLTFVFDGLNRPKQC